ncbi:unnamed protein product, partial [Polarella glacialis]
AVARKTKLDIPARYGYKADLPLGVGFLVEERTTVKVLEKAIAIPSGQSNSQGYMILYAYCQKAGVESILQGQLPPMMPATKKEPAEFADLAAIADNFGISVATKAAASNSEYCVALRVPAELATQAETPGRDLWIVRFDQDKVSPLLQAAKEGDAAKVRKGLGDGASGDVVDEEGISALMMAAMAGSADSCQALLENSTNRTASVNYAEPMSSRTALMFAAQGGHAEAVKVLAAASADVSKVDKEGTTALMWAAVAGKAETAKLLAAQGHKDLKNAQGLTALQIAEKMNHADTVAVLRG